MKCPECASDVPVLREFCPNCGAPTDAALRDARGGRSKEELEGNRKTFLIGGAAVLGVLAVLGQLSWPGFPIRINADDDRRGPAVIEAQQVYDAYREDPEAAARRFDDREMVVSGEFLRTVPDGYGSLDMRFKTSNPEAPLGVDLAGVAVEDAKKLRAGQRVTVSCQRMSGGGDNPWLQDCAIQSAADAGSALPRPPAPPPPPPPPGTGNES